MAPDLVPAIVTTPVARVDAVDKVRGVARYVDDLDFPGLLYCKVVTSAHAHAEVLSIDVSEARASPGVLAVLTAEDVPGENQIGVSSGDQPLLVEVGGKARMMADRVALVAADTLDNARAAAKKVKVTYRVLPIVSDVDFALSDAAPAIHEKGNLLAKKQVIKGDVEAALAAADHVIEGEYRTGAQEHVYIEPNGVIAFPEADGGITLHGSLQCPYYVHKALKVLLTLTDEKVRVVQCETGGGFGGKEEYPSLIAGHAALLAVKSGRPVKIVYDRTEDMVGHHQAPPRHRQAPHGRDGRRADRGDGHRRAAGRRRLLHALAGGALARCIHAAGPYRCDHVRIDGRAVMTNAPPNGAFRGFGAPQTQFATEVHLGAHRRGAGDVPRAPARDQRVGPGDTTATGQVLEETAPRWRRCARRWRRAATRRSAPSSPPSTAAAATSRRASAWPAACTAAACTRAGNSSKARARSSTSGRTAR